MESRNGEQEVAGAGWIDIEGVEQVDVAAEAARREEEGSRDDLTERVTRVHSEPPHSPGACAEQIDRGARPAAAGLTAKPVAFVTNE